VIHCWFGRFGQIVARVAQCARIKFTALDSTRPRRLRTKVRNKVYYGDASVWDLLRAAGAEDAATSSLHPTCRRRPCEPQSSCESNSRASRSSRKEPETGSMLSP